MGKKKMIVYVDSKVFSAVRKRAFELETFKSSLVDSILADALNVKVKEKPCLKKETLDTANESTLNSH